MRAAVIGTGRIAAQHLACLRQLPGVEIAAVSDLSPALAAATADRFGVARWYTDHRALLTEVVPEVVHVTTPPASHFGIARDALEAGAHVIVEKPISIDAGEFGRLRALAEAKSRWLIEDQNYLFNPPVRRLLGLLEAGRFGSVVHLDAMYCLRVGAESAPKGRDVPGGFIGHFLSHLAYLCNTFIGCHEAVSSVWINRDPATGLPSDEMRALVRGDRATALLGFSGHSQPDAFIVRVYGEEMRASLDLLEGICSFERLRNAPRTLQPVLNVWSEAVSMNTTALRSLFGKLRGKPGVHAGVWELLRRVYEGLAAGSDPPISLDRIAESVRLVDALLVGRERL